MLSKNTYWILLVTLGVCFLLSISAQADLWTRKADMPTPRTRLTASAVNGKIYVIGGVKDTRPNSWIITSAAEVYDPIKNEWKKMRDMPKSISSLASSIFDGKIYTFGGAEMFSRVSTLMGYDPITNRWENRCDMPNKTADLSVCTANGKIYAIGGSITGNPNPIGISDTLEYDPIADKWTRKADMPTPRYCLATAAFDGKIYAIGGISSIVDYASVTEEYDPVKDTWAKKADIPEGGKSQYFWRAETINNKIYAMGCGIMYEYDPIADTWTKKQGFQTPRVEFATAMVNGKIYVIGGTSANGPDSTVEEYTPDGWSFSVSSQQKIVTMWGDIKTDR